MLATQNRMPGAVRLRFAFISSNRSWGGSEELWAATAERLATDGHGVRIYKSDLSRAFPRVRRLERLGCGLFDLGLAGPVLRRFPLLGALASSRLAMAVEVLRLFVGLVLGPRPDLVVVSQGGNHDGWPLIAVCRSLGLPYVCLSHKASDLYWPADRWREPIRRGFAEALACYFVSEHNLRLTEEQIGDRIENPSLVANPFKVRWQPPQPWPDDAVGGIRLACVGRLNVKEKGQDLLLRVLASEKWRRRAVSVTVLGEGEQREGMERLAARLGLTNVRFVRYREDMAAFWAGHHALVLPSRAEGLPLVVVEAMLSGRVPIVTNVGGNAELIEDGITGFIAAAPTEKCLDETLERAWLRCGQWPVIGAAAAAYARTVIPADPAGVFAQKLLDVARGSGRHEGSHRRRLPRPRRARGRTDVPAER